MRAFPILGDEVLITLHVEVPYASFRKSYARSFAETYPLPPPATVYGMLLSLVGERFRRRHEGVRLAFAYKCRCDDEFYKHRRNDGDCRDKCLPHIATTLRKLSRYKYGVPSKQSKLGNAPDFIETLCGIEFLCWVDSSQEKADEDGRPKGDGLGLEGRIVEAIQSPTSVDRYSLLCLGLSDDAVNDVSLCQTFSGVWHRLSPSDTGTMELPVWVDHVGAANTRWRRFEFEETASPVTESPGTPDWAWTQIIDPRPS
ncbi:type I-MYXAN CRISPR-associated protein Cas5/Cmx5/DevS [soil metagenome]